MSKFESKKGKLSDFVLLYRVFDFFPKARLIDSGLDVGIFLNEFAGNYGDLKFSNTNNYLSHKESKHAHLRLADKIKNPDTRVCDILDVRDSVNLKLFPNTMGWINNYAKSVNSSVGRVFISESEPFSQVLPHWDYGKYHGVYDRYHLILEGEDSKFFIGFKVFEMKTGDLWTFNNKALHWVRNGEKRRVHLIFDLSPNSLWESIKNRVRGVYYKYLHRIVGDSSL